jgi:hypothetical protein
MNASPDEIDRLLRYMPIIVMDGGVTEWERQFCATMIRRNRSGSFRPSPKQMPILKRIVDSFQKRTMTQDAPVIEAQ